MINISVKIGNVSFYMPYSIFQGLFTGWMVKPKGDNEVVLTDFETGQSVDLKMSFNDFIEKSNNYDQQLLTDIIQAGIPMSSIHKRFKSKF